MGRPWMGGVGTLIDSNPLDLPLAIGGGGVGDIWPDLADWLGRVLGPSLGTVVASGDCGIRHSDAGGPECDGGGGLSIIRRGTSHGSRDPRAMGFHTSPKSPIWLDCGDAYLEAPMRFGWFIIWVGWGCAGVMASTVVLPLRGGGVPDMFEYHGAGGLFSNPASMGFPRHRRLTWRLEFQQPNDGQTTQLAGVIIPLDTVMVGVGWYSDSVTGLVRTARQPVSNQIIHLQEFGASLDWIALNLAVPLSPDWSMGLNADLLRMVIDNQDGIGLAVGMGMRLVVAPEWVALLGVRRLLSTPFTWAGGHVDQIEAGYTSELRFQPHWATIKLGMDASSIRLGVGLPISREVTVAMDRTFGKLSRFGVGFMFQIDPIALQYSHSSYPDSASLSDTDAVAISLEL